MLSLLLLFPPTFSDFRSPPRLLSEPLSLCSSAFGQLFEASPQQEAQQEVLQDVRQLEQQIYLKQPLQQSEFCTW